MPARTWLLVALLTAACGSAQSAPSEPWRSTHPDPAGITFDETAPGLCAVTVQFPDEAPAAVDFNGITYIQRQRQPAPGHPPGKVIGTSGGWTVTAPQGSVDVDTGPFLFQYRPSAC